MLASRNEGTLVELRALARARDIAVVDLRDIGVRDDAEAEEAIECFATFEENALAKARYFSARVPGRIVLADDSGLVVDALGGAPGVRSKRWSGRTDLSGAALDAANNARLVSSIAGHVVRDARFVCAAAFSDGQTQVVVRGEVAGRILDTPAGRAGFGYDPYMFVDELGMTLAEATLWEKQRVSHRARAFHALFDSLARRGLMQ